jgi:HisA/HisF family protein
MTMRLLPVIDVLRGQVVRGVAGRRDDYRPLHSRWVQGADPLSVAAALRDAFGFRRFYLADLDGIVSRRPNQELYRALSANGYELLVDAGVQQADDARPLFEHGVAAVIAGLESLPRPQILAELIARHGPERIVFSLDLQSGLPKRTAHHAWPDDPLAIAEAALEAGVARIIVLDLADVGTGTGGSTTPLCRAILERRPDATLIAGGGVRGEEDVLRWQASGISELLVASALHDGRLPPEFVRRFLARDGERLQ